MSNEITVRLKTTIKNFCDILKDKDFKIKSRFLLDDIFFIPSNLKIDNMIPREILKKAVLLRDITEYFPKKKQIKKFTYKRKDIDEEGNIISQEKTECEILNIKQGTKFIETIGFKELMRIREFDEVYEKDGLELIVKNVENSDNLMEVELVEDNDKYNSIEKIKQEVKKLNLPIDTEDYFVKKAEIELEKILKERENKDLDIGE